MPVRNVLLGLSAALAACASANDAPQPIPGTDARVDGPLGVDDAPGPDAPSGIDAPPADAAIPMFKLSQTLTNTSLPNGSVACRNGDNTTADNSWYRVFRLADEGITGGARITAVSFGVQQATGFPTVQIKIGTYSGSVQPPPATLDAALITPLAETSYVVPTVTTSATQYVTVPITANAPALSQVIIEIAAPDMLGTSKVFRLGANTDGEDAPAYLKSVTCGNLVPETAASLGFPGRHFVITATGTN